MCGGTYPSGSRGRYLEGLSPRVRGNHDPNLDIVIIAGSIPACAGEPASVSGVECTITVYPRVCGGTSSALCSSQCLPGLSPRVRGNRVELNQRTIRERSIPACAGEPPRRPGLADTSGVYPRVCGGTSRTLSTPSPAGGLSPRVRGNLTHSFHSIARRGSIPACAGEPRWINARDTRHWVYPRVCGGTRRGRRPTPSSRGLSPRVRGNRISRAIPQVIGGSIPACAGEPPGSPWCQGRCAVYPRVCGGTFWTLANDWPMPGLSPRVRGNLLVAYIEVILARSIPACAGEPSRSHCIAGRNEVYPRVCGGTSRMMVATLIK